MKRIAAALVIWLCALAPAPAQDKARLPLVGVLRIDTPATVGLMARMFRGALAALGDVDGETIRLDIRLAEGDAGRFPEMAAGLVRDRASVIVASGEAAARAAQAATRTIPIVASTNDLVASGLIASLAKPGGNLTGVSMLITELDAKRLEMLKEIVPAGRRFGVLNDPAASGPVGLQAIADTARALGVELVTMDIRTLSDVSAALSSLRAGGADGVNILSSPLLFGFREQLGALLLEQKLPAVCEWQEMTASGCLASYGTRALGLTVPQSILARADEVIE